MADEVDQTADRIESEQSFTVGELRRKAAAIPEGRPGECDFCGEHFARVVEVTDPQTGEAVESCARCRDQRGIV